MCVEGLACGCLNPIVNATIYAVVPARLRSRALGAITSVTLLITPLGALAAGYAVSAAGLDATLLTAAGLYLVVTIVPATHSAWQRMNDTDPDPAHIPEITPTGAGPEVNG
jgi:MFS family permease